MRPGATYHFRLIAANQNHEANLASDEILTTAPPPRITAVSADHVTESSAQLHAAINPEGLPSTYRFEYDTTPYEEGEGPHGTSVPAGGGNLPAGSSPVPVSQTVEGLSPGVTYHWRAVAENADGDSASPDHTFVYLTANPATEHGCANEALRAGAAYLPDCRAYEMVTPPRKNGAQIGVIAIGIQTDMAASGERLIAPAIQCFAGTPSCTGSRVWEGEPFLFQRTGSGWTTTPLAPPASSKAANSALDSNADTGTALFSIPTEPAGEDDFYSRNAVGETVDIGPISDPALGAIGINSLQSNGERLGTADLSHLLWESLKFVWPFSVSDPELYEYVGSGNSRPMLVGVSGGEGSESLLSECKTRAASASWDPGVLSADGRTVFFEAGACPTGTGANAGAPLPVDELFARVDGEKADAHTVAISEPSPSECGSGAAPAEAACREAPLSAPRFEVAAADGSAVLFTSTQQLLPEASEDAADNLGADAHGCTEAGGPNGCNLYLFDLSAPAGQHLIDVSAGDTSGGGPRVQNVTALSPDGSRVYFIARGVLTEAPNEFGQVARDGAENLYLFERDDAHPSGRLVFVARVTAADRKGSEAGSPVTVGGNDISRDGRYLVFASSGDLTPDASGSGRQIYRYDAETETLTRISIGARGFGNDGNEAKVDAAVATPFSDLTHVGPPHWAPTMSEDASRIFFTSPAALVPGALDEIQIGPLPTFAENVYEWEEAGQGGCTEAAGCVSLISDGRDTGRFSNGDESSVRLVGTGTNGRDVIFSSTDPLLPSDVDSSVDYYDAREGGGFAEPPAPTPCEGDACKGQGSGEGAVQLPSTPQFTGPEEGAKHPQKASKKKHHRKHKHRRKHQGGGNK